MLVRSSELIFNYRNCCKKGSHSGIVDGFSGLMLAVLELYEKNGDKDLLNYLNELIDSYDENLNIHNFGYGSAGFLWALNRIDKKGYIENAQDYFDILEPVLEYEFNKMIYVNNVDYFNGSLGILFYFLTKNNANAAVVQGLVDSFTNRINRTLIDNAWYRFEPYKPTGKIRKVINFGVPHGITGILLILLIIKEKGYCINDILIKDIVDYMMKNELIHYVEFKTIAHYYPTQLIFDDSKTYSISGLAWCYGDLMAGYAILKAGIALKNTNYYNYAIKVLKNTLNQEFLHTQKLVLCHGYTSLSHINKRIFQITNIDAFSQKADYWKKNAINEFSESIKRYNVDGCLKDFFEDPSLFFGFPGFILSLLKWDSNDDTDKDDWINCLLF